MVLGRGQKGLLMTPAPHPLPGPFPSPVRFGGGRSCVPCLWACGKCPEQGSPNWPVVCFYEWSRS